MKTVIRKQMKLWESLDKVEKGAWKALSQYRFKRFGYLAETWMHLNRAGNFKRRNPFLRLIYEAQAKIEE